MCRVWLVPVLRKSMCVCSDARYFHSDRLSGSLQPSQHVRKHVSMLYLQTCVLMYSAYNIIYDGTCV